MLYISLFSNKRHYDWESLLNSYKKYAHSNSIVLEIGASTIHKTNDLAKYCKRVIGVELMPERIPQNTRNISYRQGDWQTLTKTVRPNSIDIAVSSHVIEHIPYDLKALNELYSVLKTKRCCRYKHTK